jgi:hypothetical protein
MHLEVSMAKPLFGFRYWVAPVFLLPTVVIWGIWIKAFGEGGTQEQRIQIFRSHFAEWVSLLALELVPLATSLAAVALGTYFFAKSTATGVRVVNVVVILVGLAFTLLNVFQFL